MEVMQMPCRLTQETVLPGIWVSKVMGCYNQSRGCRLVARMRTVVSLGGGLPADSLCLNFRACLKCLESRTSRVCLFQACPVAPSSSACWWPASWFCWCPWVWPSTGTVSCPHLVALLAVGHVPGGTFFPRGAEQVVARWKLVPEKPC